jgi:hypothetical protein
MQKSFFNAIILLSLLLILILILRLIINSPTKETPTERFQKYWFEYDLERYSSLAFFVLTSCSFFSFIIISRVQNVNKELSLIQIKDLFHDIIIKTPLLLIIINTVIIVLVLYTISLSLKIFHLKINKEIVKLHFYYLDKPLYIKYYELFKFKYACNIFITKPLITLFDFIFDFIALGYHKKHSEYTEKELLQIYSYAEKHEKITSLIINFINNFIFYIHYVCFFCFLLHDLFFNSFVLHLVFQVLPLMLLYQIYINITKFVSEKTLTDICSDTNTFFYHKIVILNKKTMLVDDEELYDIPENFIEHFCAYEASGFTKQYSR